MPFWPFNKKEVAPTPSERPAHPMDGRIVMPTKVWPEKSNHGKLGGQEQMEVARLLGWLWSPTEIATYFEKHHGIKITYQSVLYYQNSPDWKPIIAKFNQEYVANVLQVPIANKRKRLERLENHYQNFYEKGELKDSQSVLRDARAEMEERRGDVSFHFTQVNNNEFTNMTDVELAKIKLDSIKKLEILNKEEIKDASEDSGSEKINGNS